MKKSRRTFSAKEKVAILRRHFLEKTPVSDLCDEYSLHPTLFYRWQKTFFEKGEAAFEQEFKGPEKKYERQIITLEEKLSKKEEIMESHVALKKKLGLT